MYMRAIYNHLTTKGRAKSHCKQHYGDAHFSTFNCSTLEELEAKSRMSILNSVVILRALLQKSLNIEM